MLNVWLLSEGPPALLPDSELGIFFSGSAFMVLYSCSRGGVPHSSLHFWRGSGARQYPTNPGARIQLHELGAAAASPSAASSPGASGCSRCCCSSGRRLFRRFSRYGEIWGDLGRYGEILEGGGELETLSA